MPLNCTATVDVVVHLGCFRNIDLYARGIYALRVFVECEGSSGSDEGYHGVPYASYSKPMARSSFVREQPIAPAENEHSLQKGTLLAENWCFQSRAFVIRYRDECVDLTEGAQFQLAVPITQGSLLDSNDSAESAGAQRPPNLILKVELLMAELEKSEKKNLDPRAVLWDSVPTDPGFSSVAEQVIKVSLTPAWGGNRSHMTQPPGMRSKGTASSPRENT